MEETYKDRMERLMKVLVKRTIKVLNEKPNKEFKLWKPVATVINGTKDDYSKLAFFPFWKGNDGQEVFHLRPAMMFPDGRARMGDCCLLAGKENHEEISTFFIRGLVEHFCMPAQEERKLVYGDPEPSILDAPFRADFIVMPHPNLFEHEVEGDLAEHYGIDRHELYHLVEDIVRLSHQHKEFFDLADRMGMNNISNITGTLSDNRTIGVRIRFEGLFYGGFCPFVRLQDGKYIEMDSCFREMVPPYTYRDFVVTLAHYYLFLMAMGDGLVEDAYTYNSFDEKELEKGSFSKSYKV